MTAINITDDTKAIALLCASLGRDQTVIPLRQGEYNGLARWLLTMKMRPKDLFHTDIVKAASNGSGIDHDRLKSLLARGVKLGFCVEEWQKHGIWLISRSDKDYPKNYKKHLKDKSPPLLFGIGQQTLLQNGGIAIVGSRNVDAEGESFTQSVGQICAFNKMIVISGGARGVDQIAMKSSIEAGGTAIGVLAENLLKKSLERSARHAIARGQLVLISPYHPNARFTVGTAMGRNKLIYALADYGLVVSAEYKKGGTWSGAAEELKRANAITVFSRQGLNVPPGNRRLLELGAMEWPGKTIQGNLKKQLDDLAARKQLKHMDLFDFKKLPPQEQDEEVQEKDPSVQTISKNEIANPGKAIYEAVLPVIIKQLESPATVDQLSETLDVSKTQLNSWLKKASVEGKIQKLARPSRYCRTDARSH